MTEYINKEVAKRIIDSERSKEQMLTMLDNVTKADVVERKKYRRLLENASVLAASLRKYQELEEADGCTDCAFTDKETWEMPCMECKRNSVDYWRRKEVEK